MIHPLIVEAERQVSVEGGGCLSGQEGLFRRQFRLLLAGLIFADNIPRG